MWTFSFYRAIYLSVDCPSIGAIGGNVSNIPSTYHMNIIFNNLSFFIPYLSEIVAECEHCLLKIAELLMNELSFITIITCVFLLDGRWTSMQHRSLVKIYKISNVYSLHHQIAFLIKFILFALLLSTQNSRQYSWYV